MDFVSVLNKLAAWTMDFGATMFGFINYNLVVAAAIFLIVLWLLVRSIVNYRAGCLDDSAQFYRTVSIAPTMTRAQLEAIFGTPDKLMFEKVLLADPKSDLECLRRIHPELYQAMERRWKLVKRELSRLV